MWKNTIDKLIYSQKCALLLLINYIVVSIYYIESEASTLLFTDQQDWYILVKTQYLSFLGPYTILVRLRLKPHTHTRTHKEQICASLFKVILEANKVMADALVKWSPGNLLKAGKLKFRGASSRESYSEQAAQQVDKCIL